MRPDEGSRGAETKSAKSSSKANIDGGPALDGKDHGANGGSDDVGDVETVPGSETLFHGSFFTMSRKAGSSSSHLTKSSASL